MFKTKQYNDKEYKNLELKDMKIGDKVTFFVNEVFKEGQGQYGRWTIFNCRNEEQGFFSLFVGDNTKTDEYNTNLMDKLKTLVGKKVTLTKKAGETKSGKVFKYFGVVTEGSQQTPPQEVKGDSKDIELRNTKTGESEAIILRALKENGKFDDYTYFSGTLYHYGADKERVDFLWENREKIKLD